MATKTDIDHDRAETRRSDAHTARFEDTELGACMGPVMGCREVEISFTTELRSIVGAYSLLLQNSDRRQFCIADWG